MRFPDSDSVRELIDWKPPLGVISVFVDTNPADRDEAWRIELKDGLEAARNGHDEVAFRATVDRIAAHFPPKGSSRNGLDRFAIGFVEVARDGGREEWIGFDGPSIETAVKHDESPLIAPVLELIGKPVTAGIVTLSTDFIQIYEWHHGMAKPLETTEIELPDWWRERKFPAVDASHGTSASSSGRDQYEERLDEQRAHYLAEIGEKVRSMQIEKGWHSVFVIGSEPSYRAFVKHLSTDTPQLIDSRVLIRHDPSEIAEIATTHLDELAERRCADLVDRALTAVMASEGHGTAGVHNVRQALAEARVAHLLYDCRGDLDGQLNDLVRQAVATGAEVTALDRGHADAIAGEHGGVVAVLRY
ncbi:MAG: VLRF1 family aeRF1-type release factor [Solirubrobacterales bacterium]